jgi:excisionase family DNA binding protein
MKRKEAKMLTTKEVAERLGAAESSVRMWARNGRFSGAREIESPRGPYWEIPDTALETFSMGKAGRPAKPKTEATKKGKAK